MWISSSFGQCEVLVRWWDGEEETGEQVEMCGDVNVRQSEGANDGDLEYLNM